MARRGDELHEHILWSAKDVFLEMGFERASMDAVAARAATSKRSLYAHFESKDKLFAAVEELVARLYQDGLKTPDHYGDDAAEAIVLFCGRFLQVLLYEPALRACRLFIAEADRLPPTSALYYDAIFETAHQRLAAFLSDRFELELPESTRVAEELVGRSVYPRLMRGLLGLETLAGEPPDEGAIAVDLDLAPIRRAVAEVLPAHTADTVRR